jgi:hypothetical protein
VVWSRLVEGDQGIRGYTEGSSNKEEDSSKSELHDGRCCMDLKDLEIAVG